LLRKKSLEGNVFKIRSFIIDSILKKRSELLAEEAEEGGSRSRSGSDFARSTKRCRSNSGSCTERCRLKGAPKAPKE
jgi:hypothetical protein